MSAIVMLDHAGRNPETKIDHVEYNIRKHDNKKILVIPGIKDSKDLMNSLNFHKHYHEFHDGKYKVHQGFYEQTEKLFEIAKDFDLFVGHSLGGAIAQILSLKFNKPAITFGSPRIGNRKTASALKNLSKRIKNRGDSITHLPPWWLGFCHGGELIEIGKMDRPWWKFWDLEDHDIADYLKSVHECESTIL